MVRGIADHVVLCGSDSVHERDADAPWASLTADEHGERRRFAGVSLHHPLRNEPRPSRLMGDAAVLIDNRGTATVNVLAHYFRLVDWPADPLPPATPAGVAAADVSRAALAPFWQRLATMGYEHSTSTRLRSHPQELLRLLTDLDAVLPRARANPPPGPSNGGLEVVEAAILRLPDLLALAAEDEAWQRIAAPAADALVGITAGADLDDHGVADAARASFGALLAAVSSDETDRVLGRAAAAGPRLELLVLRAARDAVRRP